LGGNGEWEVGILFGAGCKRSLENCCKSHAATISFIINHTVIGEIRYYRCIQTIGLKNPFGEYGAIPSGGFQNQPLLSRFPGFALLELIFRVEEIQTQSPEPGCGIVLVASPVDTHPIIDFALSSIASMFGVGNLLAMQLITMATSLGSWLWALYSQLGKSAQDGAETGENGQLKAGFGTRHWGLHHTLHGVLEDQCLDASVVPDISPITVW